MTPMLRLIALLLVATAAGCAPRTVQLAFAPQREELLARIAIEDRRAAEAKATQRPDDWKCIFFRGDDYILPSKLEYLRHLLAERLPSGEQLALRIDRFDTIERCEASMYVTVRRAQASAVGGIWFPPRGGRGPGDDFTLHLAGTANGKPFDFQRRFTWEDLPVSYSPGDSPEYRRRIEGLFGGFANELRKLVAATPAPGATVSPAASAPTSAASPRPSVGATPPGPGEPAEDLEQALAKCRRGDAPACARAARPYAKGEGVAKDGPRAAGLYRRACDGGHGESCNLLGRVEEAGNPSLEDLRRAAELYRKACDAGSSAGCLNLGRMSASGRGVAKDAPRAVALFRKACDMGQAQACYSLGSRYANGDGVTRDPQQASALYRKACQGGDTRACAVRDGSGGGAM